MNARVTLPALIGLALSTLPVAPASAGGFHLALSFGSGRSCYVEPIVWDNYRDWGVCRYVPCDRRPTVVYRRTYSPRAARTYVYPRARVVHRTRTYYGHSGACYRRAVLRTRHHADRVYYRSARPRPASITVHLRH